MSPNPYLAGWGPVGAADATGQQVFQNLGVGADVHHAIQRLAHGENRLSHGESALAQRMHAMEMMLHHTASMAASAHHRNHHTPEMDVVIGFDTINVLAPNASIVVVGIPVVPVNIKQLIVPSTFAGTLAIQEIRVGMKPFNASASFFSAAAFSEQARVVMPMDIGVVAAGTQIQVTILSLASANQRYVFNMHGKNLDNACAPDTTYPPTLHHGHHPGHMLGHPGMHHPGMALPAHVMTPGYHPAMAGGPPGFAHYPGSHGYGW